MTRGRTKYFFIAVGAIVLATAFFIVKEGTAATLSDRLRGYILLQVESKGEAWYVDPITDMRWYLGRPADAFRVMRERGLGITNVNLARIPEAGVLTTGDVALTARLKGRILLQVEAHGEAWYVDPRENKRYFLGRPDDAFRVMRERGLGITNVNLAAISVASGSAEVPVVLGGGHASDIVRGMNEMRRAAGAPTLMLDHAAETAAQRFAEDMVTREYFDATTPEGKGVKALLLESGYEAREAGILLAEGPRDAGEVLALWSGAESKAIIERAEYEDLGLGVVERVHNGKMRRVWVVMFAASETRYEARIAAGLSDTIAWRQEMLERLNVERAKAGRASLVFHDTLHQSAQKKADEMLALDYFAHESPSGVAPHDLMTTTGYPARSSAENLAKGPTTVQDVMDGWMNSPGHKENILREGVKEVGFAVAIGRNASGFQIYWVQHFGSR